MGKAFRTRRCAGDGAGGGGRGRGWLTSRRGVGSRGLDSIVAQHSKPKPSRERGVAWRGASICRARAARRVAVASLINFRRTRRRRRRRLASPCALLRRARETTTVSTKKVLVLVLVLGTSAASSRQFLFAPPHLPLVSHTGRSSPLFAGRFLTLRYYKFVRVRKYACTRTRVHSRR